MSTLTSTCAICSRPILFGGYHILSHGEMAHLTYQGSHRSANAWPDGIRHLVCLNCSRVFESDSKAQRLCRACRQRALGAL
jgi:hypothetical protein